MNSKALKKERLEARVTAEQKALFAEAADLAGLSLSEYVVTTVSRAAEETVREHRVLDLSRADQEAFAEALMNPPEPTERLRQAVEENRDRLGL